MSELLAMLACNAFALFYVPLARMSHCIQCSATTFKHMVPLHAELLAVTNDSAGKTFPLLSVFWVVQLVLLQNVLQLTNMQLVPGSY